MAFRQRYLVARSATFGALLVAAAFTAVTIGHSTDDSSPPSARITSAQVADTLDSTVFRSES